MSTFVQTHRIGILRSESHGGLWTLSDNDLSMVTNVPLGQGRLRTKEATHVGEQETGKPIAVLPLNFAVSPKLL